MILGIITGIVILVLLVVVHELGHAIVAHRNGVVVEEFGIGFPPKAWAKKLKNGVLFTLNWLPLGGFVRLKGEYDAATEKGSLGAATFWQKTKIISAGVVMNWVVAAVLLTILAWTGLPKVLPNQFSLASDTKLTASPLTIAQTIDGSPAAKSGFKAGDEIISVDGTPINTSQQFTAKTRQLAGKTVNVELRRDSKLSTKSVQLQTSDKSYVFGASLGQSEKIQATWSAPIVGVVTTAQFSWETVAGLGNLLKNLATGFVQQFNGDAAVRGAAQQQLDEASSSVAGPIGIIGVIFPSAQKQGLTQLTLLTAVVSIALAVLNFLPIPALDGGRWWTLAIFKLTGKKLTKEIEEKIQATGVMILFGLIILVTISDVAKLW